METVKYYSKLGQLSFDVLVSEPPSDLGERRSHNKLSRFFIPTMSQTEIEKTGKIWTWSTLIRDHAQFAAMLPGCLAAYIVPGRALPSATIESVMLTMNSYNTCPYCSGLHGQLARMAGVQEPDTSDPAVVYAKTFAIESGRGPDVDAAFGRLAASVGLSKAGSVQSLCWTLLWGKTTGNTINNARDKILKLELVDITLLDIFILAYYGPLFVVIGILNIILKFMPRIPSVMGNAVDATLWFPLAINILPLGLASIVLIKLGVA